MKKKGRGRMLLFMIPIVAAITVVGLGVAGIINIPGITHKKTKKKAPEAPIAANDKKNAKPSTPPAKTAPPKSKKPAPPPTDPDKGIAKLAAVWGEMEPEQLLKVVATYKDAELAPVLAKMDEAQVATLLGQMPPDKAAALSKAIQKQASLLPPKA